MYTWSSILDVSVMRVHKSYYLLSRSYNLQFTTSNTSNERKKKMHAVPNIQEMI